MGLFSRKKKTFVTSVVYNMAGDEFKRPNYLKTTVSSAIISSAPSMTESIVGSYLNGPAMKFRSFLRWTDRTDYTEKVGLVTGQIKTGDNIDPVVLAQQLPITPGSIALIQNADIDDADFSYWVDQHVSVNFPSQINTNYTADINEATNKILITFADGSITEFTPIGFDKQAKFLYVIYVEDDSTSVSAPKIFIYKQLSGNAVLDAMFLASKLMRGFYPPIPFRLNNKFLGPDYLPEVYEAAKKGYKKATTGKYDKLIESLEENKDLKDIDYAYIVFGVCLNVMEQSSRKYIYHFFEEILNDFTTIGDPEYAAWQTEWNAANAWSLWKAAQGDTTNPLNGTPEPERLPYPQLPLNSIKVSTGANPTMNFDMTISWATMQERRGTGLLKPGAKPDTLWFEKGGTAAYNETLHYEGINPDGSVFRQFMELKEYGVNTIVLNWQVTKNTWRKLIIVGMKHTNMIYGGKAVEIEAWEALDDPEESGFIIPLHDGVYRAMGLKDATQMTTACSFMVFNCYKVVKQKWYQTTLFKIIIVIIILVILFYTGYFSAEGVGLLGTNAAVGAALGVAAGTALAVVVGAIANYVAAMIVVRLITEAATSLFGEKWGPVIGAIVSFFVIGVGTNMQAGQSMGTAFGNLMSAQNIMSLTMAVGDGYAAYMQASAMDKVLEQQNVLNAYKVESQSIQDMWEKTLGFDNGIIDPRLVTSAFGFTLEPPPTFLQRTLMTGSDVADMSMGMLTNYARMTLSTDLPT